MDMNLVSSVATNNYATSKTYSKESSTKETTSTAWDEAAAVYEKSDSVIDKSTDRSAIIQQLQNDIEAQKESMMNMVRSAIQSQGKMIGTADDVWKFLASGDYTVSEAAKLKAQEAISEDGYWGVKQTSDRIVDFAIKLSGGDVTKAETLINAFKKGYEEATAAWGKELPDISKQTYDAVMDKFQKWQDGTYPE